MTRLHKRPTILVNNKLIIYVYSTDFTRTKIISRERDRIGLPLTPWGVFLIIPRKELPFNILQYNRSQSPQW